MPVDPNAKIEISAFNWVPDFAKGYVRDLRVRWALEEVGLSYRERLIDAKSKRSETYLREQPFGQVPIMNDGDVRLFESGAIVLHIADTSEVLMPRDLAGRARTRMWVTAALNSIEPMVMELISIDVFNSEKEWARLRRPEVLEKIRDRLRLLSNWLGERDYLEDRFTAGDLMMTTVLRSISVSSLVGEHPNLARYLERCVARPAFERALAAQLAAFDRNEVTDKPNAAKQERKKAMPYIEGFVVAVPAANKEAYRKLASDYVPYFKELGATRLVEAWGDDVPDGKVTDFKGAVAAKPDEVVVFSWLEYPDKAARDAANEKMRSDPSMKEKSATMPFDGKRMIFGGFAPISDDGAGGKPGYIDGSLLPVPAGNETAYRELAAKQVAVLIEHGASRVVDAWSDDIPVGKVTDYKRAVKAKGDEAVVYSWVEWPSKAARDAGWQKVFADPRMQDDKGRTLYDGQRRIFGGFAPIVDA